MSFLKTCSFILSFIIQFALFSAQASTATLGWNPSTEPSVTGYKVYRGLSSRNYTQVVDAGNVTTYTYSDIEFGNVYYFAVTAYNSAEESPYSTEAVGYTFSTAAGANGMVVPSGVFAVNGNLPFNISIWPYQNYHVEDVTVDGISVGPVTSYTFPAVSACHSVQATFAADLAPIQYSIVANADAGGTISPTGVTTVTEGASQTFVIAPALNFVISDVLVDGLSVGAVSSYTFTNVITNHNISAKFVQVYYSITASTQGKGKISPAGTTRVAAGANQTYVMTPAIGYRVSNIKVDGKLVGPASSYTFNAVKGNHTITSIFSKKRADESSELSSKEENDEIISDNVQESDSFKLKVTSP